MAATRKTDLHTVTRKEFEKLDQLIATTNPITATQKHADDTPNKDVIAHRAHWITLFLGWHANGMAGKPVHFPVKGYKWNDLKRYNADLHAQQVNIDWPAAVALLQANYARLDVFICALSDDALYGGPMKGANNLWTPGRWAEAAGPSHFHAAAKYLRKTFKDTKFPDIRQDLSFNPLWKSPMRGPFLSISYPEVQYVCKSTSPIVVRCELARSCCGLGAERFVVWRMRRPRSRLQRPITLSPGTLGVLLLALAGGAIVSFPLAGALSERWGADRLTVRCTWGYAPTLIVLALAPSPLMLGVFLLVFGAFHGAMDVAMNGWGAQVENRLERSTMPIFHAMFSLGAGIGAASRQYAIQLGLGSLWHFVLVAGISGAAALAVMIPLQSAQPPKPAADATDPKPLFALPTGALFFVGLIAFTVSMGEGAMTDWSAVFLRFVVPATKAQAALGYAVFSVAMVLMRVFGGVLVERFGPVTTTRSAPQPSSPG